MQTINQIAPSYFAALSAPRDENDAEACDALEDSAFSLGSAILETEAADSAELAVKLVAFENLWQADAIAGTGAHVPFQSIMQRNWAGIVSDARRIGGLTA